MRLGRRVPPGHRSGFTLLEMATTVAGLIIVFGLMVSLARHVRRGSAETLTRRLLSDLDRQLASNEANARLQSALKNVPTLSDSPGRQDPATDSPEAAWANNKAFVRAWTEAFGDQALARWPAALFDGVSLRDAWGGPLVYVPAGKAPAGMARQSRPYLMSAGADRQFTTVLDNLYSYEREWDQ